MGAGYPDLVVRRASDGRGLILPTGGLTSFSKATVVSTKGWSNRPEVLISPDLTGDGLLDLVSTSEKGVLRIRPGKGNGKFKATSKVVKTTKDHTLMTAVGDINKDGRNDLVARHKGRMVALLGTTKGGFVRSVLAKGMGNYSQFIGVGDQNGDGSADVFARDVKGGLYMYAGTGSGAFGARSAVAGSWSAYNRITGGADFNGDGRGDLVARTAKGKVFIHLARGDGSFSLPIGPAANVRALRSLTSAGNLVGDAAPDLIGVKGNSLVVVPNKGTYELGAPIDTGVFLRGRQRDDQRRRLGPRRRRRRDRPGPATGRCGSTAATVPASWPRRPARGRLRRRRRPHGRGRRDRRRLPRPPGHAVRWRTVGLRRHRLGHLGRSRRWPAARSPAPACPRT